MKGWEELIIQSDIVPLMNLENDINKEETQTGQHKENDNRELGMIHQIVDQFIQQIVKELANDINDRQRNIRICSVDGHDAGQEKRKTQIDS